MERFMHMKWADDNNNSNTNMRDTVSKRTTMTKKEKIAYKKSQQKMEKATTKELVASDSITATEREVSTGCCHTF